jgi:hypothetical protein
MPTAVAIWVWFCAYLNCAGWALSGIHQLNPSGYAVVLLIGFVALLVWRIKTAARLWPRFNWQKVRRRFRRPFPRGFLILAGLALLGGALYPPTNYDALAYRVPRILHWLAAGQWHWVHTDFQRLNVRGGGMEWVMAPIIAWLKTDRPLFVIDTISFLFLPGLVFSLLTRLGVRRRVAWQWMWLFPSGYCYLLQAGSIANDLYGALIAMAAVDFALRARQSGYVGYLWTAILGAGLMTASKAFNLLLLLPWLAAAWPACSLLVRRPVISALVLAMSLGTSLIPTALLNLKYCGDWTGMTTEQGGIHANGSPVFHLVVNAVLLVLHNFTPPIFPLAGAWNQLMTRLIPAALSVRLQENFEPEAARLELGEMQQEEAAGLGFGLSLLLVVVCIFKMGSRPRLRFSWPGLRPLFQPHWLVPLATWVVMGVFMTQSGLHCPGRYMSPFYALLVAPILAGDVGQLPRRAWWRRAGLFVFLLAGMLVVLIPGRPLLPVVPFLRALDAGHSTRRLLTRAWTVYTVYGHRADAFRSVREVLPPGANPLGLITRDDPEAVLWRPFGSRRILHVCQDDTPEEIRRQGIQYVLASSRVLTQNRKNTLDEWLARNNAELVQSFRLRTRAGMEPWDWYLLKMR